MVDDEGRVRIGVDHEWYMRAALREAEAAAAEGEAPVGAVIVHEGQIIGRAHNLRETLQDPTAHAEMIALTQAAGALSSWRLTGCTMYVTLEPCPMCAGALVLARITRVIYGAKDPKAGACETLYQITEDPRLNHQVAVAGGVLAEECAFVLSEFFSKKRKEGREVDDSLSG